MLVSAQYWINLISAKISLLWVKKLTNAYPDLRVGLVRLAKLSSPGNACSARFSGVLHLNVSAGEGWWQLYQWRIQMLLQYIGPWILAGWEQPWHHGSCQTQKSQRVLEPCACAMFPPAGKECHVISSLNLPVLVMELTRRERDRTRHRKVIAAVQIYN